MDQGSLSPFFQEGPVLKDRETPSLRFKSDTLKFSSTKDFYSTPFIQMTTSMSQSSHKLLYVVPYIENTG